MAIERKAILERIRQFREHPRFPKERAAIDALVEAFEVACESEDVMNQIARHLVRTLQFAPVPANIFQAAELLAQQRQHRGAPSPYDQPGDHVGSLTDGMTASDLARWKAAAESGSRQAIRDVAKGILDEYYRRHPQEARS